MSANRPDSDQTNTSTGAGATGSAGTGGVGTTGTGTAGGYGASTGSTDMGTTRDTSTTGGSGSLSRGQSTTTSTGGGTGAATGLAAQAQQYGQKIADAASSAREYVTERAGVVGEKFQDLRNKDYGQMAEDAKQYARQNPGQALLISAAAGFLLGMLIRGSRR